MKDDDDAVSGIDINWKMIKMNNSKIARTKGSLKKNSKRSDIVQKGRVGWTPKPYF